MVNTTTLTQFAVALVPAYLTFDICYGSPKDNDEEYNKQRKAALPICTLITIIIYLICLYYVVQISKDVKFSQRRKYQQRTNVQKRSR